MKFDEYKKRVLWKIINDDRSNEGKIDDDIKELCDFINSLENYCTLSSCSGRISVLYDTDQKTENVWAFKTHHLLDENDVRKIIEDAEKTKEILWIRLEPFILHIAAKDIDSALKFMKIAQVSGIKHSGIISVSYVKVVIEMQSVERANMILSDHGKIIINDIGLVKDKLNSLLLKTRKRLNLFFSNLKENRSDLV